MSEIGQNEGKDPEGFRVPIHTSVTIHHLMAGIPRALCILLWTFVVALSMPLRTWYAIPLGFFFHAVAYAAARRDPLFWDVFRRALRYRVLHQA